MNLHKKMCNSLSEKEIRQRVRTTAQPSSAYLNHKKSVFIQKKRISLVFYKKNPYYSLEYVEEVMITFIRIVEACGGIR